MKTKRFQLLLIAILAAHLFGFSHTSAATVLNERTDPNFSIANNFLHVAFDPGSGELIEMTDLKSGKNFIRKNAAQQSLWRLETGKQQWIELSDADSFHCRKTDVSSLELVWTSFTNHSPDLTVTVDVHLLNDEPMSEWHIKIDHMNEVNVESIHFPCIPDISKLGNNERLAVPRLMGELAEEPRALFSSEGSPRRAFEYPGFLGFQCIALYEQDGLGFYAAANDTASYRKDFVIHGDSKDDLGFALVHYVPDGRSPKASYSLPYKALLGSFKGDWITAAERYRSWGVNQPWAKESRLASKRVPDWLLDTGLWVWNRGRAADVLRPAAAAQEEFGVPISIIWHWWHGGPYDTSFPDYIPPRDGDKIFKEELSAAQAKGINAIVYMNQRRWSLSMPSWKAEGAEEFALKRKDGTLFIGSPCAFDPQPMATMCVATPFWIDKYAGLSEQMLNEYGVDGIYMDQAIAAFNCYDPTHNHSVGGGTYWIDGNFRMTKEIRRRASKESDDIVLAGEHSCESWLPNIDLFLTLQVSDERYKKPGGDGWKAIPFFQAVYHAFGITYGSYSSLTIPPYDEMWPKEYAPPQPLKLLDKKYSQQYYLEQARAFTWGMQPTLANFVPSLLEERPAEIAYLKKLVQLRQKTLKYLLYGTFQRPPEIDVPDIDIEWSRLSIYAGRLGGGTSYTSHTPGILTLAWKADDGDLAIVLTSIVDEAVPLSFNIPPKDYGLERGGTMLRIDASDTKTLGTFSDDPVHLEFDLPPREVWVLEFKNP
jgi:hypothetical protein